MNFKFKLLCLLSVSILIQSPDLWAAKKTTLEEVKELQTSLLKNKNSINNLLNTKAHFIPKEIDSLFQAPGTGAFGNRNTLSSAVRQVSLEAIKENRKDELFKGPDAMAKLLNTLRLTDIDKVEPTVNLSEKVYSITVLNPQNLEVMKKANAEFNTVQGHVDEFLTRMSRYVELTMKGERFITYKQAEELSNQIYNMNHELESMEELAIKLPAKEQQAIEIFRKNMDDFLYKKLVFIEINKLGFNTVLDADFAVALERNHSVPTRALNKNYTNTNIENNIRAAIIDAVIERNSTRWDDLMLVTQRNTEVKINKKDLNDLKIFVNNDRVTARIITNKFAITTNIYYPRLAKLVFSIGDKELYNHNAEKYENYYTPNNSLVRAQLEIVKGYETQMKNIYKHYGLENFGTNLGKVEFLSK